MESKDNSVVIPQGASFNVLPEFYTRRYGRHGEVGEIRTHMGRTQQFYRLPPQTVSDSTTYYLPFPYRAEAWARHKSDFYRLFLGFLAP